MKRNKSILLASLVLFATTDATLRAQNNHVMKITVARHAALADDGGAAAKYAAGTALLQTNDNVCNDVACCVTLTQSGTTGVFGMAADGLDVITSEAELNQVFAVNGFHTKVVTSASNCCGVAGAILGCAKTNARNIVMVATAPADVWAHEFGHTQGLAHNDTCAQLIMHATNLNTNAVTQAECNAFRMNPDETLAPCAAECYLFVGVAPTNAPVGPGNDSLYVLPLLSFEVTIETIPAIPIPNDPVLLGFHVYAQVAMNNPFDYPTDPIKMSNPLDIVIGGAASSYAPGTGMTAWLYYPAKIDGEIAVKFSIDN